MKFKIWVATNKVGSRMESIVEIDDEDLEDLDENERCKIINDQCSEYIWDMIEWSWEEME